MVFPTTPEEAGYRDLAAVQLTENRSDVEALVFLAQHVVVLLDPTRIVPTLRPRVRASG